jgi:hypothetical protein
LSTLASFNSSSESESRSKIDEVTEVAAFKLCSPVSYSTSIDVTVLFLL